jgi:flagellar export protein FliJ
MDSRAKLLHLKDFRIGNHRRRRQVHLLRLRDFHIDEHRRQVNQLQAMIADFERLAANLELEIQTEEDRTRIRDPAHFAYSTLAKATIVRRENLKQSIARLKIQRDAARTALSVAVGEPEAAAPLKEGDRLLDQLEIIGHGEAEQVDNRNHAA